MSPMLLDKHICRVFERVLRDRGYDVVQATDTFEKQTADRSHSHRHPWRLSGRTGYVSPPPHQREHVLRYTIAHGLGSCKRGLDIGRVRRVLPHH